MYNFFRMKKFKAGSFEPKLMLRIGGRKRGRMMGFEPTTF
jgi:hypothetical protein